MRKHIQLPDKFVDEYEHDGVTYKFTCYEDMMTASQFIDLDHLLRENTDANSLHIIMAIMYTDGSIHYTNEDIKRRAEIIKEHFPITIAMSAHLKYVDIRDVLYTKYKGLFNEESKPKNEDDEELTKEEIKNKKKHQIDGDGTTSYTH